MGGIPATGRMNALIHALVTVTLLASVHGPTANLVLVAAIPKAPATPTVVSISTGEATSGIFTITRLQPLPIVRLVEVAATTLAVAVPTRRRGAPVWGQRQPPGGGHRGYLHVAVCGGAHGWLRPWRAYQLGVLLRSWW